ncbi:MAG: hypothetical protein K0R47_5172 [Brevibacillus sp.]|jgi:hypothetical protein|nr:hypothetical protein [Brevibacillus sp.]
MQQFPALTRFDQEAEWEILLFSKFLEELEELRLSEQLIGTLTPLIPDHMGREECCYLMKLSEVTDVKNLRAVRHVPGHKCKKHLIWRI